VEVCPETELIAIEASATVRDDAFQIGEGLEVLVGERLIQNRPEVLRARPERGEWGLIGRDGGASRRVLKPDLEVPCGPRLPGGNIAALAFVTKQT